MHVYSEKVKCVPSMVKQQIVMPRYSLKDRKNKRHAKWVCDARQTASVKGIWNSIIPQTYSRAPGLAPWNPLRPASRNLFARSLE